MASSSSTSSPPSPPASTPSPPSSTATPPPSFGTAIPSPKASPLLTNDPSTTGFDPQTKWWMTYFKILTGGVTPEGIHHYREWRYAENEARDCKRCESEVDWVFKHSPIVRFMADRVAELNGEITPKNVYCRRCPARVNPVTGEVSRQEAGFNIDSGILLCANEIQGKKRVEDVLAHEMVHAYDFLRWKSDINGNMKHAACTEIRAAMLSGECRWSREAFSRGNWTLTQQFQRCVRTRAVQSMMARPKIKNDVHAAKVVNEVWDSCFNDTRPFDEVYK